MANLMKKFKKKRMLSSELHTRFGDPSISCPNEGSWNQKDHTSSSSVRAAKDVCQREYSNSTRHYLPTDTMSSQNGGSWSNYSSTVNRDSTPPSSNIPTGYYDDRIRHRSGGIQSSHTRVVDIESTLHRFGRVHNVPDDEESCEEEEEEEEDKERDTPSPRIGPPEYSDYTTRDVPQRSVRDDQDSYFDHSPRSPPLSVTSRMRRLSMQSTTTDHSSTMTGTTSSRHTSYTGGSSVSVPSRPPDTPRYVFASMHTGLPEKRVVSRSRYREPEPAVPHEMVPSYDELFG